jgi:formiminotetrahydrofolate cyclodeaminase
VFIIARQCLQLVDFALIVFDAGAKKVRGDSGAAISSAIAGAMSAVFIINVNLKSFQNSRWAIGRRREVEILYIDIMSKQEDAFRRIVTLQPDIVDGIQPNFFGDLGIN